MVAISLRGVSKVHPGPVTSLDRIDLEVPDGLLLAVVGPSGSGKSTLLRLIAGLEDPSSGRILIHNHPADGLPPWRRGVAMVFQDQPPYPHLNVFENVAFSLRRSGETRQEVRRRVGEVAELIGLGNLLDRRPASLSGGERRRVVLGRALARRPRVLLLDEPFSGLDAPLRSSLRSLLSDLHRRLGATMLLVTHDQADALALGERIIMLAGGRVLQDGSPEAVYDRPATVEVARFLGEPPMNLVPVVVARSSGGLAVCWPGQARVGFERRTAIASPNRTESGPVVLGLRPEHLELREAGPLVGLVRSIERRGPDQVVEMSQDSGTLRLRADRQATIRPGDAIRVFPRLDLASWFDPGTGRRIEWPGIVQSGP